MLPKPRRFQLFVAILAIFMSDGVLARQRVAKRMDLLDTTLKGMNKQSKVEELLSKNILNIAGSTVYSRGEQMVSMLKLLTIADNYFDVKKFDKDLFWMPYLNVMKNFILRPPENEDPKTSMQNSKECAEEVLDWQTFDDLIRILRRYQFIEIEKDWASFVVMLAVETTTHLEKSFTKSMIYRLNGIRNRANAIWGLYRFQNFNGELPIRFTFKAIIIDKNLSNRNNQGLQAMLKQMKGLLAEDIIQTVIETRKNISKDPIEGEMILIERIGAICYYAFVEFSDSDLSYLTNELAYVLELFNLLPKDSGFLKKFHEKLNARITAQSFDKRELLKRQDDFKKAREITSSNDLITIYPKYLDYCAIVFKMANNEEKAAWFEAEKRKSFRIYNDPRKVYYQAIDEMLDDRVFNDHKQLLEYYKYHRKLYSSSNEVKRKGQWMDDTKIDEQLKKIGKRSYKILEMRIPSPADSDRLHILSHLGIQLCNIRFNEYKDKQPADTHKDHDTIWDMASIYIEAKKFRSQINTDDLVHMNDWSHFTYHYPYHAAGVFDADIIAELEIVARDQLAKPNSDNDAVALYIFLVQSIVLLTKQDVDDNYHGLVDKVFKFEQKIGNIDTTDGFIYRRFNMDRQMFYVSMFYIKNESKSTDVKYVIDKSIETITSLIYGIGKFDIAMTAKHELLKEIFQTTINNPNSESLLKNDKRRSMIAQIYESYRKKMTHLQADEQNPLKSDKQFEDLTKVQIIKDLYDTRVQQTS